VSDPSLPADSPWLSGAAPQPMPMPQPAQPGIRHSYPLLVRDHSLTTAFGLLMRSLPYALARFAVLLAASVACIIWLVVTFGGAAWLGTHIATAFGWVWLIACIVGVGWFWATILRYILHVIACGHVAVLTAFITDGRLSNATEGQFAYGRRVVTEHFGQVTALYGLNALVRGVLQSFHNTLDWISDLVPIPGLGSIASLFTVILRAATRYLDKVILSYNLARKEEDPWQGAQEGIIYYCQNAKPILTTSLWIVVLERVLSILLWLLLLAPAAAVTVMLPHAVREMGGVVTVLVAVLLAATLRASFLKPLFLIMIMVRFHTLIEHQAINEDWAARLGQISDKFRTLVSKHA
jgi:hypothetical protein